MSLAIQDAPAGEDPRVACSRDAVFSTLANERRRYVLQILHEREAPLTIRELTEQIAAWENGVAPEEVTYRQRKRVYTSLHQTHLPKLSEAGAITSERSWDGIRPTDRTPDFEAHLEVVDGTDPPWCDYYLGLAGVSVALVTAVWADVHPFTLLPDLAYAALLAAVLAASAAVHRRYARRARPGGR
ncbi:DUF7344 domain-containing protein [Halegenticoccus soli]|uniref:DUF7344 domain-containing protein n=1 Tax=Halegenticoccus soli TaxID=1985678 RepID=UPI000C6DF6E8|nr:helix-turn-helix transcriptional regulator [Halegenticoccus soli]